MGVPADDAKWWTLGAVAVATFMLLLDITIVNVALPAIQRSLHSSFTDLQWVVDAYSLMLAASLLVTGSLADRIGRRRVFVLGLGFFTVASLGCGLAQTPNMLTLLRALQGVGGAMMFATSLALIAQAFHGPDRAVAFSVIGAVTGAAVAIGPVVGGVLTDGLGWEWIFFVNIPIGIAAIVATRAKVAETSDRGEGSIDWLGAGLFSAALFLLVLALIRGNDEGWGSAKIVVALIGAGVLLVAFVIAESRAGHPLLDLSLFRTPAFVGVCAAAFALSASMFAMFLYLTLYVQTVLGYTPLQAGIRFLPITLLSFCVAPIAGRLSARVPTRLFLGGGLVLVGCGLALMHGIDPGDSWTTLLAGFLVAGAGIGTINPPLASAAISVVEPRRSGMASGINNTFRQVGIATGIAGLGAIFASRVQSELGAALAGGPGAQHVAELSRAVTSGGANAAAAALPPGERAAVVAASHDAFIAGMNTLLEVGSITALVGAVVAFTLVRQRDFVVSHAPGAEVVPAP